MACRDKSQASAMLSELHANALVFGFAFKRWHYVLSKATDGLAMIQALSAILIVGPMNASCNKKEEALELVYEICPHIQFEHFIANSSILEVFEGEKFVHVVDLGMTLGLPHGHQWHRLIQSLASHIEKPPCHLRNNCGWLVYR
ncbi:hypothetical protein SLE2022_294110 [Rubroshorea leprosula]